MSAVKVSDEVLKMVQDAWLTGDNERDAQVLKRNFKGIGFSIAGWREIVKQARRALNVECREAGKYARDHREEYKNRN